MALCYPDYPGIFSRINTQCGPFRITQLAFDCPYNSYKISNPKSVTSKNGTFPCGQSIRLVGLQEIPFIHVSLSVVKNGKKRSSYVTMGVLSYLMTVNGVLYAKAGNVSSV